MAPFEVLYPDEMHVPPTPVFHAISQLYGIPILTSSLAMYMAYWYRPSHLFQGKLT